MQDTEIQELFARLTAQFEDCAALAAEGQRAGLSREEARKLLHEIRATKGLPSSLFSASNGIWMASANQRASICDGLGPFLPFAVS